MRHTRTKPKPRPIPEEGRKWYFLQLSSNTYYPRFLAGEWLFIDVTAPIGPHSDVIEWLADGTYRLRLGRAKDTGTTTLIGTAIIARHAILARLEG